MRVKIDAKLLQDVVDVLRGDRGIPCVVEMDSERAYSEFHHLVEEEGRVAPSTHADDAVVGLAATSCLHPICEGDYVGIAVRPDRVLPVHLVVDGTVAA